jgi:hypothetical protein
MMGYKSSSGGVKEYALGRITQVATAPTFRMPKAHTFRQKREGFPPCLSPRNALGSLLCHAFYPFVSADVFVLRRSFEEERSLNTRSETCDWIPPLLITSEKCSVQPSVHAFHPSVCGTSFSSFEKERSFQESQNCKAKLI